ncbi:MAG: hypothetical protein K9W45_08665 [Candidatus Heimdallarchaeum aukensis]|uniref:Uncharacterized protein n=1 Tax=Candidatus Heimdallarchaeum aukensis TaxID=2876573 RepID=A0A9Y1BIX2_9ARCH|nr:MAG: hypothetical protein K9W45_08665 [Candidatus Heimdallarchaeum aukensis]
MSLISIGHDTCILLAYIYDDGIRDEFENYLEISNNINNRSYSKYYHLLLKSVVDEISAVIGSRLGNIIKEMSKKLQEIIPERTTSLSMKQLSEFLEYMEDLETIYPKDAGLIRYIKRNMLDKKKNYSSLIDTASRRKKFSEMISLKNRFDINYFSSLFGTYFKYYDPTDKLRDTEIKEDFEEIMKKIFKGARTKRNTYDKIHIYSCCAFIRENRNDNLKFTTSDQILLENSRLLEKYFEIVDMQSLVRLLYTHMDSLPESV